MKYKGYDVVLAKTTGGKAGRGCNKTSTVQVQEHYGTQGDYLLHKQIRFNLGTEDETRKNVRAAIAKATAFIDKLVADRAAEEAAKQRVVTA